MHAKLTIIKFQQIYCHCAKTIGLAGKKLTPEIHTFPLNIITGGNKNVFHEFSLFPIEDLIRQRKKMEIFFHGLKDFFNEILEKGII
jgi:hypothetical protein